MSSRDGKRKQFPGSICDFNFKISPEWNGLCCMIQCLHAFVWYAVGKVTIPMHSPGTAFQTSPGCWLSRWRRRWHGAPAFLCRTPLPAATAGRAAQIWTPSTTRRKLKFWDWMLHAAIDYSSDLALMKMYSPGGTAPSETQNHQQVTMS